MGDAEQFVSEALQEGHSMPDIIEAMSQHSNPSLQGFAKNWNQVASQPTYQPGMGPSSGPETQAAPSSLTPSLDMLTSNPYKTAGVAALGYGALQAGRSIPGIIDAARSRYFPNQSEMNATTNAQSDALKAQAYAQQTQAQAAAEAGNQAPEIDAHEEYLKEHERRRAEIKTQMEEAKLEQLRNKGVKPEGKPRPVSPQDQAILDAISRGNVKPVGGPTPAPPPPTIGAPAPTAAPAPTPSQAVATQQTQPIQSTEGISSEAPKEMGATENGNKYDKLMNVSEKAAPVTTATEAGGAATKDQNAPKSKTEAPKVGVAPPSSGTPTVSLPEEWAKVNKGKGMTWLTSSMGPEGAQDFIERYNNGKPFESHQQMMDRFGEVVSKPSFSDIPKDVRKSRGIESKQSGYKIVAGSKPPVSEGGFASPEALGGIGAGLLGAIDIAHTVKQANQAYKNGDYELAQAHANEIRNLHPLGLLYNQLFTKTPEDIELMRKQSVFDKPEIKSQMKR
jgi:hypothetical protein